jgi:hypothetical protein
MVVMENLMETQESNKKQNLEDNGKLLLMKLQKTQQCINQAKCKAMEI